MEDWGAFGLPVLGAGCFDLALGFFALDPPVEDFAPWLMLDFLPVFWLPRELAVVGTKMAMDCPGLSATGIFNLFQAAMLMGVTSCRLASVAKVSPF